MGTIGERVTTARLVAGFEKIRDLAQHLSISEQALGKIESGKTKYPRPETIAEIAEATRVNLRWLSTGKGPREIPRDVHFSGGVREEGVVEYITEMSSVGLELDPRTTGKVPLISSVTAGEPDFAVDNLAPGDAEEWLYCNAAHSSSTFALRVDGDSMERPYGMSYPNGSIIFVDPEKRGGLTTGDPIVARIQGDGEVTFKALAQDGSRKFLKPLNTMYQPIMEEFEVLGKVILKQESPE